MKTSQFFLMSVIVLSGCVDMRPAVPATATGNARIVPVCQQFGGAYQCQWIELTPQRTIPVPASARRIVI
jgi:hypothetical protein